MCRRVNYGSDSHHMHDWESLLAEWPKIIPNYNVAPAANIAAFRNEVGEPMRWGLIPRWSEDFDFNYATFNARIETIDEKPTFKSSWKNAQRCLIPISGYYEWKGDRGNKQPFYVMANDGDGLVLAGLYDSWKLDKFLSCTILTKEADNEMSQLHHRIPIILTHESAQSWLNGRDNIDKEKVAKIERPDLVYFPVSKAVNSTVNNRKSLIEPIKL